MNDTGDGAERRMHPWSWLFVLAQQVRPFVVPLLALLFFGARGNDGDLWAYAAPVIAVAALVLASAWQCLSFRYRIGADRITVRSGLLHRNLREIPFARIHNVTIHQNLLHRLFGVAELRLESAGGRKPEAEMRVLALHDALALEARVRHHAGMPLADASAIDAATATPPARGGRVLLAMPTAEVVRLGLVSNRGMLVVAAGFGALWQIVPDRLLPRLLESWTRQALGYADGLHGRMAALALAATLALLLAWAALRLLSVALALTQYHGFTLSEAGSRLQVERGLLGRIRTSVARRRIQAWTLREGVLHRMFGRRSLNIDTAVVEQHGDRSRSLDELAPLATPAACDALVRHLLPGIAWPPGTWHPTPSAAAWRLMLPDLLLTPLAAAALAWHFGPWGLLALAWLPWSAWLAFKAIARMGYTLDERRVAVRGGGWSRWWRFAELDKLQALQLQRSPLDRVCGTATLWLDTAGARVGTPALRIRFLPSTEAQALYAHLAASLARRRLRW